jgi:predicted transcriptional regulator/transposase-like protein
MRRGRFTEDQIIGVLREHEAGVKTAELYRKHGISDATFYNWKAKYGGMTVSEAARLRTLEDENRRLKKLLAESMLDVFAEDWTNFSRGGMAAGLSERKMADESVLVTLTADIVAAHVSNNSVAIGDLPNLISSIYGALGGLGEPQGPAEPEKPKGAVSVRASVKPDHLVSMIDGRPYKMLKRHLSQNGYTPDSYREAFGLPRDYPMVAATYAEQRRALAKKIGLGRKPGTTMAKPPMKRTPKP